jgi:hypothetical protein
MNSAELTSSLIYRAKHGRIFYVYRNVDGRLHLNGPVPFDLSIIGNEAEFVVLALTQQEAELQVDQWLIPRT